MTNFTTRYSLYSGKYNSIDIVYNKNANLNINKRFNNSVARPEYWEKRLYMNIEQ